MEKNNFEKFEKEVMENIINEDVELSNVLLKQYNSSFIKSREFTGHGFYTDYIVDDSLAIKNNLNFELGNTKAEINGLKFGAGFILFIRNGLITTLEGYSYGEPWPSEIKEYKLFF